MSGPGASVAVSSAAHAMLRKPAVADAAAIIVLNLKKPRREIPMEWLPPMASCWPSRSRKNEACGRQCQSKSYIFMKVDYSAQSRLIPPFFFFRLHLQGFG